MPWSARFTPHCAELREGRQPGSERVKGGYLVEVNAMWEIAIFVAGVVLGGVLMFVALAEKALHAARREYQVRNDDASKYWSEL